jgi:hypothetical protein
MAISITINGSVTLDESAGLQTSGIAVGDEDNNDSDVTLATLQSAVASFYSRLFGALELNLSTAFSTANGVARSATDYISLSGTGGVVSLGFTDSSGAALPIYGVDLVGAACNLTALDGGAITLFMDPADELGNQVAYGVDEDGDIVFALYMEPAADLLSARVWMVQFEAFDNPVDTNDDDPLVMTGLGVGAGVSTEFNFSALPSGQNLFGMVGSTSSGLIVIGKNPLPLNDDGTMTNASNTINTSQGGGPTTIGINNQMFDPGDGAYFTFVKNPVPDYLAGAPGGLDQNEADDADNMQYTGGTIESDGAFVTISQIQGNTLATMDIAAYNISGSPQGQALITASGQNAVTITAVRVYNAAGTLVEDSDGSPNSAAITITFGTGANGIPLGAVRVSGLDAGYKIEWDTSDLHDQVLITGVVGKFDIGGFGVNEATSVNAPLTGVRFEDDGPTVDLVLDSEAELRVDESTLPAVDSITAADLWSTNSASFGTDGPGADDSAYMLVLGADTTSGLFDTLSGLEVILSINGAGTLITGAVNGGADVVFTIAIDADTGDVTLTQSRAMVNGDPTDPDENDTPLTLANGTVSVQRIITDGDDDSASDTVDISPIFKFEDAGPTLPPATQDALELITDDTDITDSATLSTDLIFPGAPNYGSDGPHATTPLDFSLRLDTSGGINSGLVDTATGKAILWKVVGSDIVGYVDTSGDGVLQVGETTEAVRYSLTPVDSDTETVTFSQSRAVFHALADPNETVNSNQIFVDRVAIDGDGDPSEVVSFDLGAITFILDDEPTIGPIADGIVDFELNDSVTKTLSGDVNNDPKTGPYTLTNYTPSLVIDGVTLHGVLAGDAKSVTYWADTNGDTVFGNAGDTAYYNLTLGDQAGAGNYTFTVLLDPPPAFTEFTFDLLPSGANLFGVVASGNSALLVIGENPVVNGAGDYTNASDVIHTSQGGTGATIGVNNQMFDPGDGAYFTFINDPDPDFISGIAGGLTATEADNSNNIQYNEDGIGPATQEVTSAFLGISQIQGGKAGVSMSIEAFNITGGPQDGAFLTALGQNHVDITEVRVLDANGDVVEDSDGSVDAAGITITIGLDGVATVTGLKADYTVEWDSDDPFDQVLVSGVSGKFDVGRFGSFESHETPDQVLEFTAQVVDGDGDTASDTWKIGIDGTGSFDDNLVSGVVI